MDTIAAVAAKKLGKLLAKDFREIFGSAHNAEAERLGALARITIEGIGSTGIGARLQRAWLDVDVVQCGYCQAGQIMSAAALLARNKVPNDAEIEGAISVATPLGTAICGLCAGTVAAALQQHSKVDRGRGMTSRVRVPIGAFCRGQIAAFFHQNAKVEPADRVGPLIDCPVSAPRHSPQALRFAER